MPIIVSEPFGSKGKKDAKRHRDKQREAIKKNLPQIISEESIITRRKDKTIKIPIKSIEVPVFKPLREEVPSGIGQGKGKPGDIIGNRPGSGSGRPGEPGQEPGEDYLETEIDIEELVELMLEDLGLPLLEERDVQELIVELGFKVKGITTEGPRALLDRRRTTQEGLRRFYSYHGFLQSDTKLDPLTCYRALKQANGILNDAIDILSDADNKLTLMAEEVAPFPIFATEDLRFRDIKEDTESQSNAVIIAMMDVSGSMGDMKKYLSRSMLFWLVKFLEKLYNNVEIRFIIHHSLAKNVDEDTFFQTGESGGTNCYTAYELARGLVETEYPTKKWNVYVWHFSDGDDGTPDRTVEEVGKLIDEGVNMIGFGQVQPTGEVSSWSSTNSTLWKKFKDFFRLREENKNNITLMQGDLGLPFLGVIIEEREDLLPALKAFLKKDRWTK